MRARARGLEGPEEQGERQWPRRRRNGGGRPEGGWGGAAPLPPPACPLLGSPARLPRAGLVPGALGAPIPWSRPSRARPAFPAEGGSRAWGGARARARGAAAPPPSPSAPVLPGRRARTVPLARLGTRGAAAGPRGAFRGWFGSGPPPPGASEPRLARGARPPAASRRPPWTVRVFSVRRTSSAPSLPFPGSASLPLRPPRPGPGPGFGSSPSPPLLLSSPVPHAPCLPVPRFPLQPLALGGEGGLGSRVRGGTRVWAEESFGVLGQGRGVRSAPAALAGGG